MSFAFDHVFVMCAEGAPEGEALLRAGLREGSPNTHPGQGTACRRFFFRNAYLELLWVRDAAEAQSDATRATRLWERWHGRADECCPFGIAFRPVAGAVAAPFETWAYHPQYLPSHLSIDLARGTPLAEPELFYLDFARSPDIRTQPIEHAIPCDVLQEVRIDLRGAAPLSAAARIVEAAGGVTYRDADRWHLELVFNAASPRVLDFGPDLPISLRC